MVDLDVFRLRFAKLDEFLGHLDEMARYETSVLLGDPGLLAQTERWMHLVVEASLDLGQHVIASKGWRAPATNREVFQVLRDHGVISAELGKQMEGWAGLRNVLVHLYLTIDHEQLLRILHEELDQPRAFAAALLALLENQDLA
ncbi:MAG TPA: DUF86 domain-containing protein [Thermoanaerobaculia bacterium]|nr:DUF86 domain-containing protein [Thermoanaerobaculia bacterium]